VENEGVQGVKKGTTTKILNLTDKWFKENFSHMTLENIQRFQGTELNVYMELLEIRGKKLCIGSCVDS
jgi:hypothetical protein